MRQYKRKSTCAGDTSGKEGALRDSSVDVKRQCVVSAVVSVVVLDVVSGVVVVGVSVVVSAGVALVSTAMTGTEEATRMVRVM